MECKHERAYKTSPNYFKCEDCNKYLHIKQKMTEICECGHQGTWSMRGYWRHRSNHDDYCKCKKFKPHIPCLLCIGRCIHNELYELYELYEKPQKGCGELFEYYKKFKWTCGIEDILCPKCKPKSKCGEHAHNENGECQIPQNNSQLRGNKKGSCDPRFNHTTKDTPEETRSSSGNNSQHRLIEDTSQEEMGTSKYPAGTNSQQENNGRVETPTASIYR